MENLKLWLLGAALAGVVSIASPTLRAKLTAVISTLCRRFYSWVFLSMPGILLSSLNYNALPVPQQLLVIDALKNIVYYLVRIEEILLPDGGLGPEKKARVQAKLRQLGIPDSLSTLASVMIDDAVTRMNDEAQTALNTYKPGETKDQNHAG